MDYIDVMMLLTKKEPLRCEDAVKIINNWHQNPREYKRLLDLDNTSVPLSVYSGYSSAEGCCIFKETNKYILSPVFAYKFFELNNDDLTAVFLETLDYLTFDVQEFNYDDEEEKCNVYAWPYCDNVCVSCFSAEIIELILLNSNFVFDWKTDDGSVYNYLYNKLENADKCSDALAVNSFNLFHWLDRDECEIAVLAKHYCFANLSLAVNSGVMDVYYRKMFVRYLMIMWDNMESVMSYIVRSRLTRQNATHSLYN